MLMPSIFGENLFDDFFGDFPFYYDDRAMKDTEKKLYGRRASHIMKTDIKETDKGYELVVDLPGFTKDEVKADLENGYLTISAEKGLDKDEQEKETGRYIRKERYAGACSRSFYVGKEVEKEDIKAEFKHGILTLFVPKKEAKPAVEQEKTEEAYEKLENVDTICDFQKSRLYKHIKFQDAENPYAEEMKKELIAGFQNEEDFAYMKGYKPWKKLLAKY